MAESELLKKLPDLFTDRSSGVYTGATLDEEKALRAARTAVLKEKFREIGFHEKWKTKYLQCAEFLPEWQGCSLPSQIQVKGVMYVSIFQAEEVQAEHWRGNKTFNIYLMDDSEFSALDSKPLKGDTLSVTVKEKFQTEQTLTKALKQIGMTSAIYNERSADIKEIATKLSTDLKGFILVGYGITEGLLSVPGWKIDLAYIRDLALLTPFKDLPLDQALEKHNIKLETSARRSYMYQRVEKIKLLYRRFRDELEPKISTGTALPLPYLCTSIVAAQAQRQAVPPAVPKEIKERSAKGAREKGYKEGTQPKVSAVKEASRKQVEETRKKKRDQRRNVDPQGENDDITTGAKIALIDERIKALTIYLQSFNVTQPILMVAGLNDDPVAVQKANDEAMVAYKHIIDQYTGAVKELDHLKKTQEELLTQAQTESQETMDFTENDEEEAKKAQRAEEEEKRDINERKAAEEAEKKDAERKKLEAELQKRKLEMLKSKMRPFAIANPAELAQEEAQEERREERPRRGRYPRTLEEVEQRVSELTVSDFKGMNGLQVYQKVNDMLNDKNISTWDIVWTDRGRLCLLHQGVLFPIQGTQKPRMVGRFLDFVLPEGEDMMEEGELEVSEISKLLEDALSEQGINYPQNYPRPGQDKKGLPYTDLMQFLPSSAGLGKVGYLSMGQPQRFQPRGGTPQDSEVRFIAAISEEASDFEREREKIVRENAGKSQKPGWLHEQLPKIASMSTAVQSLGPRARPGSAPGYRIVVDNSIFQWGFPTTKTAGVASSSLRRVPGRVVATGEVQRPVLPERQLETISFYPAEWIPEGKIFPYKANGKIELKNQSEDVLPATSKISAYKANPKDLTTIHGPYVKVFGTRFAERKETQYLTIRSFLEQREIRNITSEEQKVLDDFQNVIPSFEPSFGTFAIEVDKNTMKYVISTLVFPTEAPAGKTQFNVITRVALPLLKSITLQGTEYVDTMIPTYPKDASSYQELLQELTNGGLCTTLGDAKMRIHYGHKYKEGGPQTWCFVCNVAFADAKFGVEETEEAMEDE